LEPGSRDDPNLRRRTATDEGYHDSDQESVKGGDDTTFHLPDRIALSASAVIAGQGADPQLGMEAVLRALREGAPSVARATTSSAPPPAGDVYSPVSARTRFAMVSAYLVPRFVPRGEADQVVRFLLEFRRAIEHRLYSAYRDHHLPPPSAFDYPGPKAKEALLFLLVRALRPDLVIETGVDQGVSSCFILEALRQNGGGRLSSVDIGGVTKSGNPVGWLVPNDLRGRWTLTLQPAEIALPQIEGVPDLFLHDSLHTFEHMMLEFEWAATRLRPGGILASDDIGMNDAFRQFLEGHRREFIPISNRVVGLARKASA
jgi:Methyltransferase domain